MKENKKFAVEIGITISSNLVNASLAMISVIGAVSIFVIEKREVGFFFYALIFLSFCSFMVSIIIGGKGINLARKKAFKNKLKLKYTKKLFNYQAMTCLAGTLLFTGGMFSSKEKQESNLELQILNKNLEKLINIHKQSQMDYNVYPNEIQKQNDGSILLKK